MKLIIMLSIIGLAGSIAAAQSSTRASASKPADVLNTLAPKHPRLILTDARVEEIKKLMATDAVLKRYVDDAIAQADSLLDAKPLERKLVGPRLLGVSVECVHRTYALGLAWRLTGKEVYAKALKDNILTVCEFSDWNPSHFLDVAEMTHGVAVGYDWLYDYLDEKTRERIRERLTALGLKTALGLSKDGAWWLESAYNWNQVCNGGLVIGALAVAESEPDTAAAIINNAIASLPKAIASYDPDGSWGEGPGYWGYATTYTAYGLAAMESALGKDFGLGDTKGLRQAGYFPLYAAGPTGLFVNYADAGERSSLRPAPATGPAKFADPNARNSQRPTATLFWLAGRYRDDNLAAAQNKLLTEKKAGPLDVIWYVPTKAKADAMALDKYFGGPVELAVFRSSWDDSDALFASIKGGYNKVNHGHLDLGAFEIDALGQRWARDLGSDDYNLPGYFERQTATGRRWNYYRMISSSHSVIMLDGKQQAWDGTAKVVDHLEGGGQPYAVIDLTSAYPAATTAMRGLAMVGERKAVLVQDELTLPKPTDVAWGMTTDAVIAADGATAVLKIGDKMLTARILQPAGAAFTVESAEQKPPEKTNKGVSRLMVNLKQQSGNVRVAVLLSPAWPEGKEVKMAEVKPLKEWKK